MISPAVVKLATEYLDQCTHDNTVATFVGMHWYIDGRNKTMPLLEEINTALAQRPSVYVRRENGVVQFVANGSERMVEGEDMKQADRQYRREFSAALAMLQK